MKVYEEASMPVEPEPAELVESAGLAGLAELAELVPEPAPVMQAGSEPVVLEPVLAVLVESVFAGPAEPAELVVPVVPVSVVLVFASPSEPVGPAGLYVLSGLSVPVRPDLLALDEPAEFVGPAAFAVGYQEHSLVAIR